MPEEVSHLSFKSNLKFEFLRNHSTTQRKQYEEFIQVIEQRADLEENYKQGLYQINQIMESHLQTEGNFANIISALKSDQANRAQACDQMIGSLRGEILDMATSIIDEHNNSAKKLIIEGKKWEKELQANLQNYEKSRSKYVLAEKEKTNLIIHNEIQQLQSDIPQDKKIKNSQKIEYLLKENGELESLCKQSVYSYNQCLQGYQQEIGKILDEFEKQEKQRIDLLKDCVYKVLIFETQQIKSMEYDINQIITMINKLDIDEGLQEFIKKNKSKEESLQNKVFQPYLTYTSNMISPVYKEQNIKYQNLVQQFEKYDKESNNSNITDQNYLIYLNLKSQVEQIMEQPNTQIDDQCLLQIQTDTKNFPFLHDVFINLLQHLRLQRKYILINQQQDNLGKVCKVFLDSAHTQKNIQFISNLVNLSLCFQNFDDPAKPNLLSILLSDNTWQQKQFWESYLFNQITRELRFQKTVNNKSVVITDIISKEKSVIHCNLVLVGQLMLNMQIKKRAAKDFLFKSAKELYNLTDEAMKELSITIDVFNSQTENQQSNLVGEPEDKLSQNKSQIATGSYIAPFTQSTFRY